MAKKQTEGLKKRDSLANRIEFRQGKFTLPTVKAKPAEKPLADLAVKGTKPSGYRPSQEQKDLESWLKGAGAKTPNYHSQYEDDLEALYEAVMERPDFQYDYQSDPLYQSSKDQYLQAGQRAMLDTMGNASALTGGYGSSYASTAGSQAYQNYLGQMQNLLPSLYDRAYTRYTDAGKALSEKLSTVQKLENADYARYRDQVADYYDDLNFYYKQYKDLSDREYQQYLNNIDLWIKNRDYYYKKEQNAQKLAYQKAKDKKNYDYKKQKDERDYLLRLQKSK